MGFLHFNLWCSGKKHQNRNLVFDVCLVLALPCWALESMDSAMYRALPPFMN